MTRISKIEGYLEVARSIGKRSPCVRRKFGAVVVKNDTIVGSGYNGSARGVLNCGIDIPCLKNLFNEPSSISYVNCSGVHAEDNAISSAGWQQCNNAVIYLAPFETMGAMPCYQCRRKILNAQISGIYYVDETRAIKYLSNEDLIQLEQKWQMETLEGIKPDWKKEILI